MADRDECVLQAHAAKVVCMHVSGRDGRDAERRRELGQALVAPRVTACVRTLKLDVERAGERSREPRSPVRIDDCEPASCLTSFG